MRNLSTLDLNLLRVFEILMREKNVSLAAQRLNLTQPAVSNALNRLRVAFDDPLFVRTRSGMEPTPLALALSEPIHQGLAAIRAAVAQGLSFDPATSQRKFTVITTDVGELTYIAQLLRMLTREAPGIDIRVMEASREEYETLLDSGQADFAIGAIKLADTFRCEQIGISSYVAILCARHAKKLGLKNGSTIPYKTYVKLPHVHVFPRGATIEHPVEAALDEAMAERRVALAIPHTAVLSALIPATQLVASVPEPAAPVICKSGALTWVRLPFKIKPLELYMGWHKRQDGDKGHIWMREKFRSITFRR